MRIPAELASTLAAIVDEGSFDGAAFRLGITQPAVSQRLRNLESLLGQVLLVRARPLRTTQAGDAVVRLARQIALHERDALDRLGVDTGADGRRISIPLAVNADSMATWFLPPLAALSDRLGIDFDLHREDQSVTARLLESGEVMAAVTSESAPVAGCSARPLGVLGYEAVATPAYIDRWFPAGLTADALRAAPMVDFDRRDTLQHSWLRAQTVDITGVPRSFVPASHDFALAIRLGLGWGMLPRMQSAAALESGELRLLGGTPVVVSLYWQQWNLHSELLDAIAAEIAAAASAHLGG